MSSGAQGMVADDDPLMIAWKRWEGSEDGRSVFKWAAAINVSIVDGQSSISHPHLQGAIWAAFRDGFLVAKSLQVDGGGVE